MIRNIEFEVDCLHWRRALLSRFRKHEALMGLNPGEVDSDALGSFFEQNAWAGHDALDELFAALSGQDAAPMMDEIGSLRRQELPRLSFGQVLRRTHYPANRRFEIARLIADSCRMIGSNDIVHAVTDARTARQRFQRAAAQELLCPIDGLKDRVTLPQPTDEELSAAADYFDVSLRVVTHALVNKKLVSRDYLD